MSVSIYMHHVYAAAYRSQRVFDPLGGVRGGCEMPNVGAGYGTWPSVRAVIGLSN